MTRVGIVLLAALLAACSTAPAATSSFPVPQARTPTLFITTPAPTSSPAPAPAFRYVAMGASDAVGVGATDPAAGSWPARIAARLPAGTDYVNLGVAGSLAAQAAREQSPRAVALRPQLVTIWLAVNDLNASVSPTDYVAALHAVIDPLVSGTPARVFVGTVPDLRSVPAYEGTDRAELLARITAYNAAIASIAAGSASRVTAVDLFSGSGPLVSAMTVSADGFHPSDAGYALIADRFATAIAASGIALR